MKFDLDLSDQVNRMTQKIDFIGVSINGAIQSALTQTTRWLAKQSTREIAQTLGVKQAPLKRRFKVYRKHGGAKLWIGLTPISVHHFGQPVQNAAGVRVGRQQYQGAFAATTKSGTEKMVWLRTGRKRTPEQVRKGMLPEQITRVSQRIDNVTHAELLRWEQRTERQFSVFFEAALNRKLGV